jgi:DNA modification methylase
MTRERTPPHPTADPSKDPVAPEPKQRRALTHVGGDVELGGPDKALANALAGALATTNNEDETRAHIHGFHTYPARLHPTTARMIIEACSAPGDTVLDPFCGSGTVLVEARLSGRRALGVDVNPLSVRLSALKCRGASLVDLERIQLAAEEVVAFAEERRATKAGPLQLYESVDREMFAVHTLLELDSLRAGIAKLTDGAARRVLELVLSSILVKLSNRASDSSQRTTPRRLAGGYGIRVFRDRSAELAHQLAEFSELLPRSAGRSKDAPYLVWEGDARTLQPVANASVNLVVCSPPYPGVYDYFDHHALRLRWLGIQSDAFEQCEIGSKRRLTVHAREARKTWVADLTRVCASLERVLKPGGKACIVMADCAVRDTLLLADECLQEAAKQARLEVVATAAQQRPHFHRATEKWFRERPRREHLIALGRPLTRG